MTKASAGRDILFGALALVLFVVALMTAAPARKVEAASNCTYYSSANRTTIVGRFGYDCCNNPVAWGIKTKYSVCGGCFPCTPPPR